MSPTRKQRTQADKQSPKAVKKSTKTEKQSIETVKQSTKTVNQSPKTEKKSTNTENKTPKTVMGRNEKEVGESSPRPRKRKATTQPQSQPSNNVPKSQDSPLVSEEAAPTPAKKPPPRSTRTQKSFAEWPTDVDSDEETQSQAPEPSDVRRLHVNPHKRAKREGIISTHTDGENHSQDEEDDGLSELEESFGRYKRICRRRQQMMRALREDYDRLKQVNELKTVDIEEKTARLVDMDKKHRTLKGEHASLRSRVGHIMDAEAPVEDHCVKVSDDEISERWKGLSYSIRNLMPRDSDIAQGEDAPVSRHEESPQRHEESPQRHEESPRHQDIKIQAQMWKELVYHVFLAESETWGGELGQRLAKMSEVPVDKDAILLGTLSKIKSRGARDIERDFGTNQQQMTDLAQSVASTLLKFSPESEQQQLTEKTCNIFKQAVDLHAIFLKSKAFYELTDTFERPLARGSSMEAPVLASECDTDSDEVVESATATPSGSVSEAAVNTATESGVDICNSSTSDSDEKLATGSADGPPLYNPNLMEAALCQSQKDQESLVVDTVVSPVLWKIGNADGEHFECHMVICKAQVVLKLE